MSILVIDEISIKGLGYKQKSKHMFKNAHIPTEGNMYTLYTYQPKFITKPVLSFCMAIDKTCLLTSMPTAASP